MLDVRSEVSWKDERIFEFSGLQSTCLASQKGTSQRHIVVSEIVRLQSYFLNQGCSKI